jgi:hypothetical protein
VSGSRRGGWLLVPIVVVGLVLIALPIAAFTETGIEKDLKQAFQIDLDECQPMTNLASAWTTATNLPFEIDEPRAGALDGEIYLVGGITGLQSLPSGRLLLEPSDELTRLDPRTETYESLAPLPRRLNHIGVVGYRRHLYVLGGYGRTLDSHTSRAFYRYDPAANRWSRMPDMPESKAAMASGVVGDLLVVAGGARDNVPTSTAFAFNFRTGRWSRLPDMPDRREHVGAATLGPRLYVLGGRSTGSLAVNTATSYDVLTRSWTSLPPMPVSSGGLGTVAVDGEILAIGGGNDGAGTVTGAVQEWDPGTEKWSLLSGMRTPRHGDANVAIGDEVWALGGSPCAYYNATDIVERLRLPADADEEGAEAKGGERSASSSSSS